MDRWPLALRALAGPFPITEVPLLSPAVAGTMAEKVFVQVNQFVDGWEDLPVTFSAIVPATA